MRASVPLAVLAATAAAAASAAAPTPTRTLHPSNGQTCSGAEGMQSSSFHDPDSLVVGPVWIGGAVYAERVPVDEIREGNGRKLPVVVLFRHRAVISIARAARSYARLQYGPGGAFRKAPVRVRFVACPRVTHGGGGDMAPGFVRSTFFPGGFRVRRAPVCVPITIRVDGGDPVRRTVGLGMHCPES